MWSQFSFSGLALEGKWSGNQENTLVKFQEQPTSASQMTIFVQKMCHRAHSGPLGPSGPSRNLKMAITSSIFIFRASPWNLCMKTIRDDSNETNQGKIGALWIFFFFTHNRLFFGGTGSGPGPGEGCRNLTSSIFIFRASPWNLCMKTIRDDSNETNQGKIGAL